MECAAFRWEEERLNFNAPKDQRRIREVEGHHFNAGVQRLVRGQTGHWPGGDIDFLVRYSPNHHRGLAALDSSLKCLGRTT